MTRDASAFVERTFTVDGHEVSCRFFRPEPDGLSFRCRFEIHWPEGVRTKSTGGVDEVQALLLAMNIAHVDLLSARENNGRAVLFHDQRELDLPFPETVRHWVSGTDAP
jgi:hypothetical protein